MYQILPPALFYQEVLIAVAHFAIGAFMSSSLKAEIVKQRKQWDKAAKIWVEFVRSGKNYYAEYLNGPALKRMVGSVKGKQVLDIGCGEGYFSRFFAKAGAEVVGIDLSEALIKAAEEEEERNPLGVKYFAADAANLNMLDSEIFDIAYSHMAMGDIPDYEGTITEVSRVLKTRARFVIVMAHPCFSSSMHGKWETRLREDGSKEYLHYCIRNYLRRHSYAWEWKHDRLSSSFVTEGFHRTLSDYINVLIKHGLIVTRLDEPKPLGKGVRIHPPMKKHYRVPQSLVIEATKIIL